MYYIGLLEKVRASGVLDNSFALPIAAAAVLFAVLFTQMQPEGAKGKPDAIMRLLFVAFAEGVVFVAIGIIVNLK